MSLRSQGLRPRRPTLSTSSSNPDIEFRIKSINKAKQRIIIGRVLRALNRQTARSTLKKVIVADESANGSLKLFLQDRRGRWFVAKVIDDSDTNRGYKDNLLKAGSGQKPPQLVPHSVARDSRRNIVAREYVKETLSTEGIKALSAMANQDPEAALQSVKGFISQLFSALHDLHSRRDPIVLGALRPERITISSDGIRFLDAAIPSLFSGTYARLTEEEQKQSLRYVHPDKMRHPKRLAPSWDVYAALAISAEAIRYYQGSRIEGALRELYGRILWLLDYIYMEPRHASAREIHSLLFDKDPDGVDELVNRIQEACHSKSRNNVPSWQEYTEKVASNIRRFPETTLAFKGGSGRQAVIAALMLANSHDLRYPKKEARAKIAHKIQLLIKPSKDRMSLKENRLTFDTKSLPEEVDFAQRDALHRFHFGSPIDEGHDERIEGMELDSDQESKRDSYVAALGVLNRLRSRLLSQATYLTTAGVVEQLSRGSEFRSREVRNIVVALRRWGVILAVPDHDRWLYPSFQFKDARISPFMQEAHDRFCEIEGHQEPDRWHQLEFFLGSYRRLGGQTIASCLWDEQQADDIRFIIKDTRI